MATSNVTVKLDSKAVAQKILEGTNPTPFDALTVECYRYAKGKGFWDYDVVTDEVICTKLALIHSEVTEALEAVRKNKGEQELASEMADIIIRVADLYASFQMTGRVNQTLDSAIEEKMAKNRERPHRHGVNF